MVPIDGNLLRRMSCIDVHDPREMAADSLVSRRLQPGETANAYRLRDPGLWKAKPGPLLTRLAGRPLGDGMYLAINSDRFATEVEVRGAGMARHSVSMLLRGSATIGSNGETVALSGAQGAIFRGEPGLRLASSDDSMRLNFWVSDAVLTRTLRGLLHDEPRQPLRFAMALDWAGEAGASLHRLLAHLLLELRDPDGLPTSATALTSFADLVADRMLRRLPHNHSDALQRPAPAAIPRHLRRAEAFMAANAERPLTLVEVAQAAECSLRSLHEAFRRFRDASPHAALQAMRLERVRAALREERDTPPGVIARRFGFTNATRFGAAYSRRFGEMPAETQRR